MRLTLVGEDASSCTSPTGRPSPSALMFLALPLWVATAITYTAASTIDISFGTGIALTALVAIVGILLVARKRLARLAPLVAIGLLLGLSIGLLAAIQMQSKSHDLRSEGSGSYVFEVVEDERTGDFGDYFIARTKTGSGHEVFVRLNLPKGSSHVAYGDLIEAYATFKPPSDVSAEYYWQKGLSASASITSFKNQKRSDILGLLCDFRKNSLSIVGEYDSVGSSLLCAVLFGERAQLEHEAVYQSIKVTGLAHLVAVSGSHLVIVISFLTICLRAFRLPLFLVISIQIIFITAYLVCTAMPVSAIRAACMSVIVISAFFGRRRGSSINALAICIGVMVLISPQSAVSVSFALSAGATLGIVLISKLCEQWCMVLPGCGTSFVREGLSLTLASFPLTAPFAASLFAQLSLIAPLANILAIPAFTVLCTGGLLAVCLCHVAPVLGMPILDALHVCANAFCELTNAIAQIPYAALPCATSLPLSLFIGFSTLVVLWAWWPTPSINALAKGLCSLAMFLLLFMSINQYNSDDEIIMLDVGQGDAFVIRSGTAAILIDTGNQDTQLLEALARNGISRLDAVVITHPDDDHCGALESMRGIVQVGTIVVAADVLNCGCLSCGKLVATMQDFVGSERISTVYVGDRLTIGAFGLEVVWPDSFQDEGGNADSLSFIVATQSAQDISGWKVLFCGDAEEEQLRSMKKEGRLCDIDILKVGHHGSKNALSEEVLSILKPEIALVSVGEHNRYGHPSQETMTLLENIDASVFRTDIEGDVVCRLESEKISVSTLR